MSKSPAEVLGVLGLVIFFGVWLPIIVFMFWLGPHDGWLSERFLWWEMVSFVPCALALGLVGLAALLSRDDS